MQWRDFERIQRRGLPNSIRGISNGWQATIPAKFGVVPQTPGLFDAGFHLYGSRLDKAWSMVDCVSFVIMRELGIGEALTFDSDFVQAGFKALLRP